MEHLCEAVSCLSEASGSSGISPHDHSFTGWTVLQLLGSTFPTSCTLPAQPPPQFLTQALPLRQNKNLLQSFNKTQALLSSLGAYLSPPQVSHKQNEREGHHSCSLRRTYLQGLTKRMCKELRDQHLEAEHLH